MLHIFLLSLLVAFPKVLLANNFIAPLTADKWVVLAFSKIPANEVKFAQGKMSVIVDKSASPLVLKLDNVLKIRGFSLKGALSGTKQIETAEFDEDSQLRFGLVATGTQTLSGPKKWLAADWVKKLFSLAPAGVGLDKIYFYNVSNREELKGKLRKHPKSDLMLEEIVSIQSKEGAFSIEKQLSSPIDTAALWLSIDGDDTKSSYSLSIEEIKLVTED